MRAVIQTIRFHARVAPVVAAAVTGLSFYRVSECCAGPSIDRARSLFRRWCQWICPRLRLDVRVDGRVGCTPCLYLSNHRSYLDIPLLGSVLGAGFLSRADVASWPVIGPSARAIGTVFIDRNDPHSAARAARAIARRLRSHSLIVFPEGTTGGGRLPQPFVGGLFRLLSRLRVPIVPVTIRYSDRRAYWVDQRSIAEHLAACVSGPRRVAAAVHIGSPLGSHACRGPDELAAAAYVALCEPIETLGELAVLPELRSGAPR